MRRFVFDLNRREDSSQADAFNDTGSFTVALPFDLTDCLATAVLQELGIDAAVDVENYVSNVVVRADPELC